MFLQEAIRTSTEPDSRHGSRALSAGAVTETIIMNAGCYSKVGPEKPRPDYAVQPLQKPETPKKLPEQIMDGGKKTRENGSKSFSDRNQDPAQEFIHAPEPLIRPSGFTKEKQQEALGWYGDVVVAEFRATWREIVKASDGENNQRGSVDVWKSLLDPKLAPRFRASLSARYREYKNRCKQKVEQATPKRSTPIQPGKRRHEGAELPVQDDDSPVPAHPSKRRKLGVSPQPQPEPQPDSTMRQQQVQKHQQQKQPGKRQHEEVDADSQEQEQSTHSPIFPDPKRRKLTASPQPQSQSQPQSRSQPQSQSSGSPSGPTTKKGSAWRLIREQPPPLGNTAATAMDSSSAASGKLDMGESAATESSPSKKFSFKIRTKEPVAKVQVQRKNSLMGTR